MKTNPSPRFAKAAVAFVMTTALAASTPFAQRYPGEQFAPATRMVGPAERTVNLGDLWFLQSSGKVEASGEEVSQPGFSIRGWIPTLVPSTVLGTLVDLGQFGDVFVGKNLESVPASQFEGPWWYRREFLVSRSPGLGRVMLQFDGINYRADIWLNGTKIAAAEETFGAFRRWEFDVTETARLGEKNVIAVEVFPPKPGEPSIGFVDWNPAPPDRNMGLWREIRFRVTGDVTVEAPFVETRLDLETLNEARLTISTELHNHADREVTGKLEGRMPSVRFSQEVKLAPGERKKVVFTPETHPDLILREPRIWWTHDLGTPELYVLSLAFEVTRDPEDVKKMMEEAEKARAEREAEAKDAKKLKDTPWDRPTQKGVPIPRTFFSDVRTVRFGIREVSDYVNEEGHRGYKLNGKKILIRGAGWTDDIFLNATPKKLLSEVFYAKHANLNALRLEGIWGTSEALYNLCDQTGILLMVGWSCHWEWENYFGKPVDETYGGIRTPEDIELIADSWRDQVAWLRNHPSIFVWAMASDKLPKPELEQKYLDILKEVDPTRPFLASTKGHTSSVSGKTAVKMLGPYDYVPPVYWYVDKTNGGAYGFNTESGPGPQVPPVESLRKMIPEGELWPIGDAWMFHANRGRFQNLDRYNEAMERRLGAAKTVEDYARKAQFLNYESVRAMFESFVSRRYGATGVIQWMFNAAWPKLWWQLVGYDLTPNGALYGARKAGEQLHILYDYGTRDIIVTNNTREEAPKLRAEIRIFDGASKERYSKSIEFAAAADQIQKLDVLPVPEGISPVYFVDLRLLKDKNALIDTNFYCLSAKEETLDEGAATWYVTPVKEYADFTALSHLEPARLRVKDKISTEGPITKISLEIENDSKNLAFFVEMSVRRSESEELVAPIFWDDNYITLLPGEKRKIAGAVYTEDLFGEKPIIKVKGWNTQN